ncbi:hypothetical protein [Afipia clevelandensis]|uniref:Uncharacterized protein n=1 Tax=Afipia clevelandensis ATCC 49720 TaxID=883079 RepID=K8PPR9_9BRAD|nr:hypothetical protein [Afipia clevelandensis]EKS40338.1 hypothetical protein HMPREF9696_00789 [Afipia clevelandensis ATCC 49720]
MRRFLVIVLACALGLAVAFAFGLAADLLRPCTGEGLSCSMTKVIGFIYTPVFSAVALICFTAAVFWKGGRALNVALLLPLVPFLLLVLVLKYSDISVREFREIREHDIQEILQIAIPIILTLIVPWALLRRFATWLEPGNVAGTSFSGGVR